MKFMKTVSIIVTALSIAVVSFIPRHAYSDCKIKTWESVKPCIVVNDHVTSPFGWKTECTLGNIAQDISDSSGYCRINYDGEEANFIVFQPEVDIPEDAWMVDGVESGSTITQLNEPVSFSLSADQRVIISGGVLKVGMTTIVRFEQDDGSTSIGWPTNMSLGLNEKNSDPKSAIIFNDIPLGKAAITVSGGTLVLRNLFIEANCETAGACGSVIKLVNGAKLIIDNSDFIVGDISYSGNVQRYLSFIEIDDDNHDNFSDYITFIRKEGSDDVPSVSTYSKHVFRFNAPKFISVDDFADVKFEHIGTEVLLDGPDHNYVWDGPSNNALIDIERIDPIRCQMVIGQDGCVVDSSDEELVFNDLSDAGDEVLFLQRDTGKIIGGGFFREKAGYLSFLLPADYSPNKILPVTNLGQKINVIAKCPGGENPVINDEGDAVCGNPEGGIFDPETGTVECLDELARYDLDSNACVCMPQNTELKDGQCHPIDGYEWQNPEKKYMGALPECKGEAVPRLELSGDVICVCPDPEEPVIHWSPGGISTCLAEDLPASSTTYDPAESSDADDDVTDTETDVEEHDTTVDSGMETADAEQDCLDNGGTWIDNGLLGSECSYRDQDVVLENSSTEGSEKSGSFSCSLIVASKNSSTAAWLVFLALPALMFWLRRRDAS